MSLLDLTKLDTLRCTRIEISFTVSERILPKVDQELDTASSGPMTSNLCTSFPPFSTDASLMSSDTPPCKPVRELRAGSILRLRCDTLVPLADTTQSVANNSGHWGCSKALILKA